MRPIGSASKNKAIVRPSRHELEDLQSSIRGYSLSLAKPDLNSAVRAEIEKMYEDALTSRQDCERRLNEEASLSRQAKKLIDPKEVVKKLNRLAGVLAQNNPTRGNLELSAHIDRISCFKDGRVVLRTCKLGALAGAVELLADASKPEVKELEPANGLYPGVPRRRARLRVEAGDESFEDLQERAVKASDTDRFGTLGAEWFSEDVFQVPRRLSWAEEHASEVAKARATGLTEAKLAEQFGKSVPTIRAALRYAAVADLEMAIAPRKMPRRTWAADHADEVWKLHEEGLSVPQIARRVGKSEPTIRMIVQKK